MNGAQVTALVSVKSLLSGRLAEKGPIDVVLLAGIFIAPVSSSRELLAAKGLL